MPLQKSFRGLNSLLGLYTGGDITAEWGGIVTPTIDMLHFLQPPELVEGTVTANALGDVGLVTLDVEKAHILWFWTCRGGPLAAGYNNLELMPIIGTKGGFFPLKTAVNSFTSFTAGDLVRDFQQWPTGLFIPRGSTVIGTEVSELTGGAGANLDFIFELTKI